MADNSEDVFQQLCSKTCKIFKITQLNDFQKQALTSIVLERKDTFVNLPTGFGKSLIYQALPMFTDLTPNLSPIVIVVSPLVSLMKDQVSYLNSLGIKATSLSLAERENEKIDIEKGSFSVVYGSPESWLSERWRKMLCNAVYSKNIYAVAVDEAHIINHWGTSKSAKRAAFRESFSHLHELRSLVPSGTPFVALTATATQDTKNTIFTVLRMKHYIEICDSPNKDNISYSVTEMDKTKEPEHYLKWMITSVAENGVKSPRVIIYCQTIKQCHLLYSIFKAKLGNNMYKEGRKIPSNALVEMLHSCTPAENKNSILESFRDKDGVVRVLIATIAFGMGVDCKGVRTVVHFGPSKNVEAYVQECGRAGRDGQESHVWLLFNSMMQVHVDPEMKLFLRTKECRRLYILKKFGISTVTYPNPVHKCCDNCAQSCDCGSPECKIYTAFPCSSINDNPYAPTQLREVSDEQKREVKDELILYRKELIRKLMAKSPGGELVSFINVRFLLGFSTLQIEQVINNLSKLFTVNDITNLVEIWDVKHAHMVQHILSRVFKDIQVLEGSPNDDADSSDEDEDLDVWADAIPDKDLMELMSDSYNMSVLDESLLETTASSLDNTPEQLNVFDDI